MFHCVIHKDGTRVNGGAHLGTRTLECGEKLGVDKAGLWVAQLGSDVAADAEVGVLVDGAWNQRRYLGYFLRIGAKYVRESGSESRGRLDRDIVVFTNAITAGVSVKGGGH